MAGNNSNSEETCNKDESIEIEKIDSEIADSDSGPKEFVIVSYPADFVLEIIDAMIKRGEIKNPPFQRRKVWKFSQAARLIDSFLMGLPIPQIFVYHDPDGNLRVIDGQQRLNAISSFFSGVWGEPDKKGMRKEFKLENSNPSSGWYNKTYELLDEKYKKKIRQALLRAIIVRQLEPKDTSCVTHIFERLNTGGTALKGQEVRNCVFSGTFNERLIKMNDFPSWRKIVGKERVDDRMRDIELILRYIALDTSNQKNELKYEKPMKDFLSDFMERHKNPNADFLTAVERRFQRTCEFVVNNLGDKPFHLKSGLNAAVFDSVFVAVSRHLATKLTKSEIKIRYQKLVSNPEYTKTIEDATTDTNIVENRMKIAEGQLFG